MIDLSKLKAPGWHRVVEELSGDAPDDAAFMAKLVAVLGQVSGARQAALMILPAVAESGGEHAEPKVPFVWPQEAAQNGPPELHEAVDVRVAARAAAESGHVRVFGLDKEDPFYDGSRGRGYVVGVPVTFGQPGEQQTGVLPRTVVTLVLEPRSQQALQTTLALIEVIAGYARAHGARQQLRRLRSASAALDLAGRLVAAVNSAKGFKGAAFQLVNDLARHLHFDRVGLGWVKGVGSSGAIRLVALSDTEHLDRRMALSQKIEAAMDECLDQEQAVLYPPPQAEGDVLLSQAITHAHRDLASRDAQLKIASVPLRIDDKVVGVLTVELSSTGVIDPAAIELLQSTMDLVAPVLGLRRSDDRALPVRAWHSAMRACAWAVGPKHTAWKIAGIALFAFLVFASVWKLPYRVEAPVELQPIEERRVAAPFKGIIKHVPDGIVPGAVVQAGDILLELDSTEFQLQAIEARGQVSQALAERDAQFKAGKLAEAEQAAFRAAQAVAKVDLFDYFIRESQIRAPVSGTIITGDLRDRIGSVVSLGDPLFHIAQLDTMVAVAKVRDSDIGLVQVGASGQIATKAYPGIKWPLKVERIVPLAQAEEGQNAFEVHATLDVGMGELLAKGIRPGSEGIAKFDTGNRTLIQIGSRRIVDTLRLWLWW